MHMCATLAGAVMLASVSQMWQVCRLAFASTQWSSKGCRNKRKTEKVQRKATTSLHKGRPPRSALSSTVSPTTKAHHIGPPTPRPLLPVSCGSSITLGILSSTRCAATPAHAVRGASSTHMHTPVVGAAAPMCAVRGAAGAAAPVRAVRGAAGTHTCARIHTYTHKHKPHTHTCCRCCCSGACRAWCTHMRANTHIYTQTQNTHTPAAGAAAPVHAVRGAAGRACPAALPAAAAAAVAALAAAAPAEIEM
eukprot:1144247-Pelagomonas_calceolata.AAC.1